MPSHTHSLTGVTALVTRPGRSGASLCNAIENRGGHAISLPTLDFEPIEPDPSIPIETAGIAIFVSRAAVEFGLAYLDRRGIRLPARVFAVGQATAGELATHGIAAATPAPGASNSEGLLAMPPLHADKVCGTRVIIFRGQGGREHLGASLRQRGAEVHYVEVYRRRAVDADIPAAIGGGRSPTVVVATSAEILDALAVAIHRHKQERLLALPLVTLSRRIADHARSLGFTGSIHLCRDTDEAAMLNALEESAGTPPTDG